MGKLYVFVFKNTFRMKGLSNWKDVVPEAYFYYLNIYLKKGEKQEETPTAGRVAFCLQPKV
jgi:hypothetical protein